MIRALLIPTIVGGTLFSCKPKGQSSSATKAIIAPTDLVEVTEEILDLPRLASVKSQVPGIGHVFGTQVNCTLAYLGNGFAFGAGHCFVKDSDRFQRIYKKNDGKMIPCINKWGEQLNVKFGGFRTGTSGESYACAEVVYAQVGKVGWLKGGSAEDENLPDFALVKLAQTPDIAPVRWGSMPSAAKNHPLVFLAYNGGRPLELSGKCNILSVETKVFTHDCDSQGGASGAAIFSQESGNAIGIHWGAGEKANGVFKSNNGLIQPPQSVSLPSDMHPSTRQSLAEVL